MDPAFELVETELKEATAEFGPFLSAHEGLAIIEEEFLELRKAVFWGEGSRQVEATQLAAMAIRFLQDICEVE